MRAKYVMSGLIVSAVAALVPVAVAPPAQAKDNGKDDGVALVVPTLAPMLPGQTGWVSAMWLANLDICDVQVTVSGSGSGSGPTFTYPANTATFSSFYTASALATGNMDYIAFKVAMPASAKADVQLTLEVSYLQLPPGQIKKDDDLTKKKFDCKGPKGSVKASATLPLAETPSQALVQKTSSVTVASAAPAWVRLTFHGNKPGLDKFRVTVVPPKGLTVSYPGDGSSAGLDGDDYLPVGEDDWAGVRLDAAGLKPGSYDAAVRATYSGGSYDGKLTVVVT